MTPKEIAQMIDISAVRTHHNLEDIKEIVEYAKQYSFINVHVLPNWIATLAPMIQEIPDVYLGSPCGFPSGAHATETKLTEARQMIADGVEEMDIVMNVGRFRSGQYDYVLNELKQIIALKKDYMKTKVLIELNCLTDEELPKACEIVMESGADYLKTGTGWVPGGANIERIRRIKSIVGSNVKIKAAGGIRTREELDQLLDIGVERFGINTNSAIELIKTFE